MSDFLESVMNNVKSKQELIFRQAFLEELSLLIQRDPMIQELYTALDQANQKGLLNGLQLSAVLDLSTHEWDGVGARQSVRHSKSRLTEGEKKEGMELVASTLCAQKEPMTKAQILSSCDSNIVSAKWPSIIAGLKREGFVQDNGEERQKKAYLLTQAGKDFIENHR